MRVRQILLVITVAVVPSAAPAAWYGGASLGVTSFDHDLASFDDGSIISGRVDDSDSGWKVYGGYRLLPFLGLELGYVDLVNEFDLRTTFRGVSDGSGFLFDPGDVSVDIDEPAGYYAAAVGRLPIGTKFAAFAKLGFINWSADITTVSGGLATVRGDDGFSTMHGIGAELRVIRWLRVRAEWESFAQIVRDDVEMISVGVTFGLPVP